MANEDIALTVGEAADRLALSRVRIYQLLKSGELTGPALPEGRSRYSPGAPRVWGHAVELRAARHGKTTAQRNCDQAHHEAVSARVAALALKIALDDALDELAAERQRRVVLAQKIAELSSEIAQSVSDAAAVDAIARGFSAALTQLLTPHLVTDAED